MNNEEKLDWRVVVRYGLLGSIITLYFSAIGMVETFDQRNLIGTFLSLGQVLVVCGAVGAGFLTARAYKAHDRKNSAVLGSSLVAGLISSVFPILLIIIVTLLPNIRLMFINLSPALVEVLTFGQGPVLGSLLFAVLSIVMGGLGASFVILPSRWSRALFNGLIWTLAIGVFSENVGQIIMGPIFGQIGGKYVVRFVFVGKALNPIVALLLFLVIGTLSYFNVNKKTRTRWDSMPTDRQKRGRLIGTILLIGFLLLLPYIVGLFLSQAIFLVGLYIMMGLGLNIVVGYAGLLDLGYVAFFAFGAYVMGIATTTSDLNIGGLTFWAALPICMLAGVLWGLILGFPVLRLRGDYLAIVTLGFGEIIRILALSDWLAPIEGGAQGILHIPYPKLFNITLNTPQNMYYIVILGILLAAFVTIRLRESRLGRQWMAMREDEDVAEAMGINLVITKLLAFAIGAAFSALAGGIFAARLSTIFPHTFNLIWSINALAVIIVGGLGSIPGVIVGALVLVGLPELLREFSEYRLLMYGIVLIVMMLVKPEGIIPEPTRMRELRAGDEEFLEQSMGTLGEQGE